MTNPMRPSKRNKSDEYAPRTKHWHDKTCIACQEDAVIQLEGTYYCPWHAKLKRHGDTRYWKIKPPAALVWARDWPAIEKWIDEQQHKPLPTGGLYDD